MPGTAAGFADVSIQLNQTGLSRPAFLTFGVQPTGTDVAAMVGSVSQAFGATGSLKTVLDTTVTMTGIRVSYGTIGGEDIVSQGGFATNGTGSAGATIPPNCAVLARKTTARGGRRGRGRMYLPWVILATDVSETGTILAAKVTALNTMCGLFLAALTTNGVPMYLLHGPGKTNTGNPDQVTSLTVDPLIATQRRRLGR